MSCFTNPFLSVIYPISGLGYPFSRLGCPYPRLGYPFPCAGYPISGLGYPFSRLGYPVACLVDARLSETNAFPRLGLRLTRKSKRPLPYGHWGRHPSHSLDLHGMSRPSERQTP
jgi:hypothetical protein